MEEGSEKPIAHIQQFWEPEAQLWASIDEHPLMAHSRVRKEAIIRALTPFNEELLHAGKILDVGAGGGTHVYFPQEVSNKVIAVDLSEAVLRLNPSRLKVLTDARESFPFPQNYFDVGVQFFLNRYLEHQEQELLEFMRVLKPGARFLIMDHSKFSHDMEVAEFDPVKLRSTVLKSFPDVQVATLAPAIISPFPKGSRGPLYLLSGTKPL